MTEKTDNAAETRTHWAEDRTIMANERTFSGWMRTGLGAVGVAVGLKAVFGDFEPTWAAKVVATAFLVVALVIFWSARRQARRTLARLEDEDSEPMPKRAFTRLALLMSIATIGTGAILWML